jgi:2-C-methyl-D-erythritol 4-phosphate cytidylyltransferase/2-C-methyl-D-erythritol 2,4-cyclodiphosphate synthase
LSAIDADPRGDAVTDGDADGTPFADVIVVAGGSSSRMGGIDKLTAPLGGRPVLAWSLTTLRHARAVGRVVLVVAADRVESIASAAWLPAGTAVVAGGPRRQESVAAGFAELERQGIGEDRVVLVHDGARPAVGVPLVQRVAAATRKHGAAIPLVRIVETLKRVDGDLVAGTVAREGIAAAQTPQGVRAGLLRAAYARFPPHAEATFTDEAALLEACSIPVHAIRGQRYPDNLKITVPEDLHRAAVVMELATTRVGFGHDSHPFGPGEPLALGGLSFPGAPRLHGHSDGDVVLHAVADALLGAAGLGDLGRLFPSTTATPRGVDSAELLADVLARVGQVGRWPSFVDVTVIGARPRLGPRLDEMAARIADILAIDPRDVSVKASTGNLDGMEGGGRGISAQVVAQVVDRS